jgi:glycosyltransferase involved in cell wall biosynthesis
MLIANEVFRDGRVLRSARTLSECYDLIVLGIDKLEIEFDHDELRRKLGLNIEWLQMKIPGAFHRNRLGRMMRYRKVWKQLRNRCRQLRPDVVHAHEHNMLPAAAAVKKSTGAKIIYDAHELYRDTAYAMKPLGIDIVGRMETRYMQRCDGIIACNKYRAEIMHKEYGAPFAPTVVRNVPPFRAYQPSQALRRFVEQRNTGVRRICLHQGIIGPGRGMETVVRSLQHLDQDVGIVLVGGGDEQYIEQLEKLAESLGVGERFFRHPPVDHDELFPLTCSADVGIVIYENVSRNNYYCAPNKLYEYAASGLPAVGADLPPIGDFFEEYRTGELFDANDPASLARAISLILQDDSVREQYRRNSLEAGKIMCWENESKSLTALYARLLG